MSDRVDLTLLAGSSVTARYTLTKTVPEGTTGPFDLTNAAVSMMAERGDEAVGYVEGAGVTVPAPRTAGIVLVRFDGDDFTDGEWAYVLNVLPTGADDPDVPAYGALRVVDVLDPALSEMRALVGSGVPPTDAELLADYARLGTAKKVALAVLERRYVEMLSRPASWALTGDYSEDWGSNITRMGEYLNGLRAEVQVDTATGPNVLGVATLTRGGRAR